MTTPLPPFTPIVNGVQMTVRLELAGLPAVCVVGGWLIGGSALTQEMADRWATLWWAAMQVPMSDQVTYVGATVRDLRSQDGPQLEGINSVSSKVGAQASPLALSGAAAVLKWTTTNGSRRGRGRTFLPGVTEAGTMNNGRTFAPAYTEALQNAANSYLTQKSADAAPSVYPAVLSRSNAAAYRILAAGVAPIIGIQRRRMR